MSTITGIENEWEFVRYLNHRQFKKCHPLFQELLEDLYPDIQEDDKIISWKNKELQKTDIFVKVNGIVKRISLKKGIKNSVHIEPISEFIHFLIENHVPRKHVIAYLKFHYGDGTTNGSGEHRISSTEYKEFHQTEIDQLNTYFNEYQFLEKAIDRFVLRGRNDTHQIDALVYGEINDFLYISREEIKNIILHAKTKYSTAVHFGCLTCQPVTRNLNYNPKLESKRFCVQIKWYSLFDDIIEYYYRSEMEKRNS